MGKYDESTRDAFAEAFERDGFVLLRDHFPRATLEAWSDAFAPLLATAYRSRARSIDER